MRHQSLHTFLKWAGPSIVVFLGGLAGIVAGLASSFPRFQKWADHQFDVWWPTVSAGWFIAGGILLICAYIWALVWSGRPLRTQDDLEKQMARQTGTAIERERRVSVLTTSSPQFQPVLFVDKIPTTRAARLSIHVDAFVGRSIAGEVELQVTRDNVSIGRFPVYIPDSQTLSFRHHELEDAPARTTNVRYTLSIRVVGGNAVAYFGSSGDGGDTATSSLAVSEIDAHE